MKRAISLLMVLIMVLSIAGCASTKEPTTSAAGTSTASSAPSATAEPTATPEPTPTKGGDLIIGYADAPTQFDPLTYTTTYESYVMRQVCETLVTYSTDCSEILPNLAESWEISDDGLTYTFHLNKGVYFQPGKYQNGREMTADDVKFTFERSRDSKASNSLSTIKTCEVVDDYTVKVTLNAASAVFLSLIAGARNCVVPRDEVEGWGDQFGLHIVGTGPYTFSEFVPDEKTVVVRNEKYWRCVPYLDSVTFTVIRDENQRLNALMTGEINVATNILGESIDVIRAEKDLDLASASQMGFDYIYFNMSSGVTQNQVVRQALTTAIDIDELIAGMYPYGNATRVYLPIPPGCWGYDSSLESLVPEYDPEAARALLKGTEWEDGFELNVYYSSTSARIKMATILKERLKENLNCDVILHESDFATFTSAAISGVTELGTVAITLFPDPNFFLSSFFETKTKPALLTAFAMNNKDVDERIAAGRLIVNDDAKRKAHYQELIKDIMNMYPGIFLASVNYYWGYNVNTVGDLTQRADGNMILCNGEHNTYMIQS